MLNNARVRFRGSVVVLLSVMLCACFQAPKRSNPLMEVRGSIALHDESSGFDKSMISEVRLSRNAVNAIQYMRKVQDQGVNGWAMGEPARRELDAIAVAYNPEQLEKELRDIALYFVDAEKFSTSSLSEMDGISGSGALIIDIYADFSPGALSGPTHTFEIYLLFVDNKENVIKQIKAGGVREGQCCGLWSLVLPPSTEGRIADILSIIEFRKSVLGDVRSQVAAAFQAQESA